MSERRSAACAQRWTLYRRAGREALLKLDPRRMVRNPVMLVVEVGSGLTTVLWLQALVERGEAPAPFIGAVALWLWFTLLFANFSEALAEGRGKAQAEALRQTRRATPAKGLPAGACYGAAWEQAPSTALRQGDRFLVETGDVIAADGEIVEGIAAVDESAVTGESAPVVREAGSDPTSSSSTWACPTSTASRSRASCASGARCPSSFSRCGAKRPTRSPPSMPGPTTT